MRIFSREKTQELVILIFIMVFALSSVSLGKYSGGTGEPNDPYKIADANDLLQIAADTNDYNKCFILVNDINLSDYYFTTAVIAPDTDIYHAWYTGTPFTGNLDGNNHDIENLTITQATYYIDHVGFIGELRGTVENIRLVNYSITVEDDSHSIGAIAGSSYGTIRNCNSSGSTIGGEGYIGGIVGSNKGLVIDCNSSSGIFSEYDCDFLGGIVGLNNGRVERCHSSSSIGGDNSPLSLGGLVGANNEQIIYCSSNAYVSAASNGYNVGGLVGRNSGMIFCCYSNGTVTGFYPTRNLGGIAGQNTHGNIINCYTSTRVVSYGGTIADEDIGAITAKTGYSSQILNCFWNTSLIPSVGHAIGANDSGFVVNVEGITSEQMQDQNTFTDSNASWDFVGEVNNGGSDDWAMPEYATAPVLWWQLDPWPPLPTFSGGGGTKDTPYLLSDSNDLASIGHNTRLMDKCFKLTEDIDFNDTQFFMIGSPALPFTGTFNGNGNVVKNASVDSPRTGNENIGFFSYLDNKAVVENIGIEMAYSHATSMENVGALAGYAGDNVTIRNCFAKADTSVGPDSEFISGFVGLNYGKIENCFADVNIIASDNCYSMGGIVGRSFFSPITNCYSMGYIQCGQNSRYIGGFAGDSIEVGIENCYSTVDINAAPSSVFVGGFLGVLSETFPPDTNTCFWDVNTSGILTSAIGKGLTTGQMQNISEFILAGWDFVGETANGYEDIWRMCQDGVDYPLLAWDFYNYGDLTCPDGVDFLDYSVLANEWQLGRLEQDYNSDGRVNFKDFAKFANNWSVSYTELSSFLVHWLARSTSQADIAPPGGDDFVDWQDLTLLFENWLSQY